MKHEEFRIGRLAGPPYAVAEEVFDEHSIEDCSLSADADAE